MLINGQIHKMDAIVARDLNLPRQNSEGLNTDRTSDVIWLKILV